MVYPISSYQGGRSQPAANLRFPAAPQSGSTMNPSQSAPGYTANPTQAFNPTGGFLGSAMGAINPVYDQIQQLIQPPGVNLQFNKNPQVGVAPPQVASQLPNNNIGLPQVATSTAELDATPVSFGAFGNSGQVNVGADSSAFSLGGLEYDPNTLSNSNAPANFSSGLQFDSELANATPQELTGLNQGSGFNWSGIASGIGAATGLAQAYLGFQGLDLAKDQFSFQKDAFRKNFALQKDAYETNKANQARTRASLNA